MKDIEMRVKISNIEQLREEIGLLYCKERLLQEIRLLESGAGGAQLYCHGCARCYPAIPRGKYCPYCGAHHGLVQG